MKNRLCDKRIHFIGIGGISMSALAKWCKTAGSEVSGSDKTDSGILDELNDMGIYAYTVLNRTVAAMADMVVFSSAIDKENAELVAAQNARLPVYERHEFLGLLAAKFDKVIAVAGTHGKTTVTALIAAAMKNAGLPFTAHVGGEAIDIGGNFCTQGREILVTEACEYRSNFLSLFPECAVVLNVESDHPDCFCDNDELYQAFAKFVGNVQNDGFIVVNDCVEYSKLQICKNVHIIKFGQKPDSDVRTEIVEELNGVCEYDLICNGEYFGRVRSGLVGKHNIANVLAAAAVCNLYGVDKKVFVKTVETFGGVKRRYERLGEINGAEIISDYAHHPSEIIATIAAAKSRTKGAVRVYFQPHTYSRTAKYFSEFSTAFNGADEVNFLPTYPARESAEMGRSSFELFYFINSRIRECRYFENFVDAAADIVNAAHPSDTVLIMGAGDIEELGKILTED